VKIKIRLLLIACAVGLVTLVLVIARGCGPPLEAPSAAQASQASTIHSCPMHPQIRQPEFGQCPLCGMDLVPLAADDEADDSLPRLRVGHRAAALMEIQTALVEHRPVELERRFLGRLVYDETRLHDLVVRTEGQLERLFINYAGVSVREGEQVAEIYSPEFYSAARDLVVAHSANDPVAADAAHRKLRLLQVTETQIESLMNSGEAAEHFTLVSPVSGVITQLDQRRGAWLMRGQRIAQVADLTALWVLLDAYESDIALLHHGQEVELEVAAYPGQSFVGRIVYLAPELNQRTRTLEVRVNVSNPDGRLRPGMFARALLRASLTATGEAQRPETDVAYRCPMHPEITGEEPGSCSICGMPLERESPAGAGVGSGDSTLPLVIPATAPLITGKRAVVYVQLPNPERPTFEGRTITLGPRAGEHYLVTKGLVAGERVVTHGAFKIDSELQIRGRPSMMAPAAEPAEREDAVVAPVVEVQADVPAGFGQQVARFTRGYLDLVGALAADDFVQAQAAANALVQRLQEVDLGLLGADAARVWEPLAAGLRRALEAMVESSDIADLRRALVPLTEHTAHAVVGFGAGQVDTLYRAHCPMAFGNQGADWLQATEAIANPYFGSRMFRCGDITGQLP
jgi:membrane fusion protein, copper/silver efflux system